MCGIIAGRTEDCILPLLHDGLKKLEYRGYDSFGILTCDGQSIELSKKIGPPSDFASSEFSTHHGQLGIGHTRWATHGRVVEKNAHPHYLCKDSIQVGIVHNGIVENVEVLLEKLPQERQGQLLSETDSEVIAATLLENILQGSSPVDAFEATCTSIKGQYAIIALIIVDNQSLLLARRNVLPLYVSYDRERKRQIICSDSAGFPKDCYNYVKLPQEVVFELGQSIDHLAVLKRKKELTNRALNFETSTQMEKEIFEQIDIFHQHLQTLPNLPKELCQEEWDQIDLVGCGSSYHAALVGGHWLERRVKCPVRVFIASEFKYSPPLVKSKKTLAIVLSQSGETADILAIIPQLKERYSTLIAVCNNTTSSLAEEADWTQDIEAGPEIGVASTKAYTAQVICLIKIMCSLEKTQSWKNLIQQKSSLKIPQFTQEIIGLQSWTRLAQKLKSYLHLIILGRGPLLAVALEGALKIKEITYIHAQAMPTGEMKHGSLALVDESCPVMVLINDDHFVNKNILACQELLARRAKLIVLADEKITLPFEGDLFDYIKLPSVDPVFHAIIFSLPMQLLSLHLGLILKRNVDKPRNLAKSVTVE